METIALALAPHYASLQHLTHTATPKDTAGDRSSEHAEEHGGCLRSLLLSSAPARARAGSSKRVLSTANQVPTLVEGLCPTDRHTHRELARPQMPHAPPDATCTG